MEEKLIEFKTAKLAKEKGFNLKCKNWYDQTETLNPCKGIRGAMCYTNEGYAPTQNFLKDWLREEHLIYVYPFRLLQFDNNDDPFYFDNNEWSYCIDDLLITKEGIAQMRGYTLQNKLFRSYEEAFEAGLLKALSLI